MNSLSALRADFERRSRRALSMPIAGILIWLVIAAIGLVLPARLATLALMASTGLIFPLALLVARIRGEQLLSTANPLARLMAASVFMVNLLWVLHVLLFLRMPAYVPLSVGIALGIHWVVYSWVIQHPLGYIHAVSRTLLLPAVWLAFPNNAVTACAIAISACYCLSLAQMIRRSIELPANAV